ncbi:MAG: glycosyltransferase family 2 protein [Rudaea sp.]
MSTPVLVTVMIPTYNQAQFIAEAIASVLAQNYAAMEVLVGDDASTDETPRVVARFLNDPRVRYVRQPRNLGRTANYRSLLYEHASGEFVVNLDGDDYYTDREFISKAIAAIGDGDATVIVAARTCWQQGGRQIVSGSPGNRSLSGLRVLSRMPGSDYHFQHMATLYRRELACEVGFYRRDCISSDWESLCRLALRGQVIFMDRVVGVWRQHANNATRAGRIPEIADDLMAWRGVYSDATAAGMSTPLAWITCAQLEWVLLGGHCAMLSRTSRSAAADLSRAYFRRAGWRAVLGVFAPIGMMRVAASLVGFYRWRAPA